MQYFLQVINQVQFTVYSLHKDLNVGLYKLRRNEAFTVAVFQLVKELFPFFYVMLTCIPL